VGLVVLVVVLVFRLRFGLPVVGRFGRRLAVGRGILGARFVVVLVVVGLLAVWLAVRLVVGRGVADGIALRFVLRRRVGNGFVVGDDVVLVVLVVVVLVAARDRCSGDDRFVVVVLVDIRRGSLSVIGAPRRVSADRFVAVLVRATTAPCEVCFEV